MDNQNTNPVDVIPAGNEPETNVGEVCSKCGAPLAEGQDFCPKCGTPKKKKPVCGKCGAELEEGQEFCPKCGQKAGLAVDANVSSAINQFNAGVEQKKQQKKKTPIIIAVAAVAVIVIIALVAKGGFGTKKFDKMYSDIAGESWCTIASDGSYMKLDTNPKDKDSDDLTWSDYESYVTPANDAIERINKELGFPDALMEKMNTTTWSQGKQTDSNDKYKVTWTYHPDKGLEVLYELNK